MWRERERQRETERDKEREIERKRERDFSPTLNSSCGRNTVDENIIGAPKCKIIFMAL